MSFREHLARLAKEPAPIADRRDSLQATPSAPRGERRRIAEKPTICYREQGEERVPQIVGHAAVFNQWAVIWEDRYGEMREIIRPGTFARAIREKQDVRSLFNHDSNFVLGRSKSGTLRLTEDGVGLATITDAPTTPTIRDLVIAPIERGDIDGMSFAFAATRADKVTTVEKKDGTVIMDRGGDRLTIRWGKDDREIIEREVIDVDLFDVSVVTYPAYEGTDLALRAVGTQDVEPLVKELRSTVRRPSPIREAYRRKLTVFGFPPTAAAPSGPAD